MSAVVIHRIRCDAPWPEDGGQCLTEWDAPFPTSTATELRAWLKSRGWHRTRATGDICPDCWKEGRR
jgi:hypothetical protein